MPRKTIDFGDWVKKHVGKLREPVDKVKKVHPEVVYGPKGEWTVAKILVLGIVNHALLSGTISPKSWESLGAFVGCAD